MFFEFDDYALMRAKIKVVGVGGAGGNAINRMIEDQLLGVEFIAVNSDAQDLENNLAAAKLQIGKTLTKGLGAGADIDIGRQAVVEDHEYIEKALVGADMIFVTAGMGGGTGSGAAPQIARIARDLNTLTVGIVTRPFLFEGRHRARRAEMGIQELRKHCDTTLVIPNETLLTVTDAGTSFTDALKMADSILHQATRGISDLINVHGLINLDFADVRTVMLNMGDAIMGTGTGHGEERAILAAQQAISSPLLQNCNIQGAQGLLVNVTGDPSMSLHEVNDAASIINEEAGEDANVIFGAVIDPSLADEFRVTVIATGFNQPLDQLPIPALAANGLAAPDGLPGRADPFKVLRHRAPEDGMAVSDSKDEEILVFGDDLEVPAVLRAQSSSRPGSQPAA